MTDARKVGFDHLIGVYAVGSGDWSWRDEYDKLIDRPVTQQLIESIRSEGIREPVLLGNDGRVWDGHHRIIVAMHLGLDTVPVDFAGVVAEEPEWERRARRALELVKSSTGELATRVEILLTEDTTAPWERADGCFGHCDQEGWYSPCRAPVEQGGAVTGG